MCPSAETLEKPGPYPPAEELGGPHAKHTGAIFFGLCLNLGDGELQAGEDAKASAACATFSGLVRPREHFRVGEPSN